MNAIFAVRCGALLFCVSTLISCARWLPDDPYKNSQSVPVLRVPEGKQSPAVDPSLSVPEGSSEWNDTGHKPPRIATTESAESVQKSDSPAKDSEQ
jgi:hypothetical protein